MRVLKHELLTDLRHLHRPQELLMSRGQILSVQMQNLSLVFWFLDHGGEPVARRFLVTFTGEELRYPKVHYLGTAQEITSDWNLTYHVFEVLG